MNINIILPLVTKPQHQTRFAGDISLLEPLTHSLSQHQTPLLGVIDPTDALKDFATQNDWVNWKGIALDWVTKNLGSGPAKVLEGVLPFVKRPSDAVEQVCNRMIPIGFPGGAADPLDCLNEPWVAKVMGCKGLKYAFKTWAAAHGVPWWMAQAKNIPPVG